MPGGLRWPVFELMQIYSNTILFSFHFIFVKSMGVIVWSVVCAHCLAAFHSACEQTTLLFEPRPLLEAICVAPSVGFYRYAVCRTVMRAFAVVGETSRWQADRQGWGRPVLYRSHLSPRHPEDGHVASGGGDSSPSTDIHILARACASSCVLYMAPSLLLKPEKNAALLWGTSV